MTRRYDRPVEPPWEWFDLLDHHDQQLARLRMLWRSGRGEYRAMVPGQSAKAARESEEGWDPSELDETHFEWHAPTDESPLRRRKRIGEILRELWRVAGRWVKSVGVRCDFQLVGYDIDDEVLFADGKRGPSGEIVDAATASSSDFDHGDRMQAQQQRIDDRLNELLSLAIEDRDKAFVTARESLTTVQESFRSVQESIDAAPKLINDASDLFKEALAFHGQQIRELRDRATGRIEMRAHALSEMEKTRRARLAAEVGLHMFEALIASGIPAFNKLIEVLGHRDIATTYPKFKCGQQAMAYLSISMTPHQLTLLFGDKRKAAGAVMGLLEEGAAIENERDALLHIAPVVRILRSEKFRNVATPEEQLAARYLIGRLALYRMSEYGEEQEDEVPA